MIQRTRLRLAALSALIPIGALAWYAAQKRTPEQLGGYFPNVILRDQDDRKHRFYDDLIKGKQVVIQFTYASCSGICPLVTANLVRVQQLLAERMGRDLFMYSISLRPELDQPKVLKQHMQALGIGPGWSFLTGEAADIDLIRRKLGMVDPDPAVDADVSQHTGMIRIGNEPYQRWSACRGLARPEWIAKEIGWVNVASGPIA